MMDKKRIKINHEMPLDLLLRQWSYKFCDYEFVLPHLLDESPSYKNYILKAKEEGRYIVMDNSLHELGKAYDKDRLLYWIQELEPNEFIVPDVWLDKTSTLVNAKQWLSYNILPENTILVAVVQAKNFDEAFECYHVLKTIGYKKIAFSYGLPFYKDLIYHPNKNISLMLGRIYTILELQKRTLIQNSDRIHLLGCQLPQEFYYYKDLPFIESIDTSNPVMAGLEGNLYNIWGLDNKPLKNLNNSFFEKSTNLMRIEKNIKDFIKINNL